MDKGSSWLADRITAKSPTLAEAIRSLKRAYEGRSHKAIYQLLDAELPNWRNEDLIALVVEIESNALDLRNVQAPALEEASSASGLAAIALRRSQAAVLQGVTNLLMAWKEAQMKPAAAPEIEDDDFSPSPL